MYGSPSPDSYSHIEMHAMKWLAYALGHRGQRVQFGDVGMVAAAIVPPVRSPKPCIQSICKKISLIPLIAPMARRSTHGSYE